MDLDLELNKDRDSLDRDPGALRPPALVAAAAALPGLWPEPGRGPVCLDPERPEVAIGCRGLNSYQHCGPIFPISSCLIFPI